MKNMIGYFAAAVLLTNNAWSQEPSAGSIITIKSFGGKYVSAETDGNVLIANKDNAGSFEQFALIDAGSGRMAFQSLGTGLYVVGAQPLVANRETINVVGDYEKFTFQKMADGKYAIKCAGNNKLCFF
jgi:hypothetical protein